MARQETPKTVSSDRPRRTPLSARNRLAIKNKRPGYRYRIVNDVDDRVELLMEQGYEIVPAEEVGRIGDKRVDNPSSTGSSSHFSVGQGIKAVVMAQREEYWQEDQATKQRAIDEIEEQMKTKNSDYGKVDIR